MKKRLLFGCAFTLCLIVAVIGTFLFLLFHRVSGQYFDSNGVRIHFTVEGQGEPVILVHGFAANADLNWRYPGITRLLAQHFQVITFDLRGHGLSGQPTDPGQYGVQMVEDVVRLMDHLGIQRAHVAGYSLGGFLVLKLLTLHPDRLCSVAVCAAGWKNPEDPSPLPNPYAPPARPSRPLPQQAGMPGAGWFNSLFHGVRNWAGDRIANRAALAACRDSFNELGVAQADLQSVHVPTICFIGTRDGLEPLAEDLNEHMPGLEFVIIPGASHFTTPFYGPFKRGLLGFLERYRCS